MNTFEAAKQRVRDAAADHGWYKGEGKGATCLYLACHSDQGWRHSMDEYVERAIRFLFAASRVSATVRGEPVIWRFNDHPATTIEDCLMVLDTARRLWDAEHAQSGG